MDMNFRNILWYLVDTDDMEDLWYPTIYIGNAIRTKGKNISEQIPYLSALDQVFQTGGLQESSADRKGDSLLYF